MDTATALGTVLGVGRVAYGVVALVAPTRAAKAWIGRAADEPAVHPMTRAFGVRALALGMATLGALRATGPAATGTRTLLGLGVLVDTTDAVSGRLSRDAVPSPRLVYAAAGGAALAGVAALATSSDGRGLAELA